MKKKAVKLTPDLLKKIIREEKLKLKNNSKKPKRKTVNEQVKQLKLLKKHQKKKLLEAIKINKIRKILKKRLVRGL